MNTTIRNLMATTALLAGGSMASAAYISLDFEGDAVGGAPAGNNHFTGRVEVVNSLSTPADPFGGAGNQSLLIEDNSDPSAAGVAFSGAAGGLQSGTFTTTFFLQKDDTWTRPYLEFIIGKGAANSGSDMGAWFAFNENGGITDWGGGGTMDNTVSMNAPHTLVVNFATNSWSGTLDGSPLTKTGGTVTQFGFYSAQPYIETIAYNSGFSTNSTSRAFVDNVEVVPEPAALSLLGFGALALRRRK